MSISTMAEDSALRLTNVGAPAPDVGAVAAAAAATAAAAAATGTSADEAAEQGMQAAATAQGAGAPATPAGPLTQLVKYIPTETITLYIAVLGALGDVRAPASGKIADADFSSRWAWMWILLVITLLLTLGLSYRSQKNANSAEGFRVPYFETLAGGAAFLVWALSLPSTPLRDMSGYDYNAWNSVIILAGTMAIATAAYVFGTSVTWQKVLDR